MAKRVADKYITDQNWDQEDQDDDDDGRGVFKRADQEILKTRVIRKAKRRVTPGQTTGTSAFTGFSGFKAQTNANAGGAFGGFRLPHNNGASISAPSPQRFSSFQVPPSTAQQTNISSVPVPTFPTKHPESSTMTQGSAKSSDEEESSHTSKEYNRHLSALNKSVSDWIKNHVEKNPLCDLTPIFLDYKKYLSEIDEKYGHSDNEASKSPAMKQDSQETASPKPAQNSAVFPKELVKSEESKFKLSGFNPTSDVSSKTDSKSAEPPASKPFTGFQVSASVPSTTSPFKGFGTGGSKGPAFPGFSFSSSMVGAGNSATPTQGSSKSNTEEEEYVPPKPESNVVVEDDAFFTIRCKLYYKKDDSYTDRGVGQLYLKPVGSKTQLLIRADTAISQILLNILLSPSIPLKRQGKNNILIMCIPNPPINEKEKDKVMTLLIRVKTSDDADNLLGIMEKKKKEAKEMEEEDQTEEES